eukprot:1432476-Rhodomonas_salina.3
MLLRLRAHAPTRHVTVLVVSTCLCPSQSRGHAPTSHVPMLLAVTCLCSSELCGTETGVWCYQPPREVIRPWSEIQVDDVSDQICQLTPEIVNSPSEIVHTSDRATKLHRCLVLTRAMLLPVGG